MTSPNSLLTRIRQHLVRWLEPGPDAGEAWCLHCSLSGGKTRVLSLAGITCHTQAHADAGPHQTITIQSVRRGLA